MDDRRRARTSERFEQRCAYCDVHEDDAGATLTIDHHRPRAHDGDDEDDNLVYACPRCNDHKGSYWHEHDPPHVRLLHPLRDALADHLREEEDGRVLGITEEGIFFIRRLQLNRTQLVAYRRGLRARQKLREELAAALQLVHALEHRMNALDASIDDATDDLERD
ncbi:MAG: HNH endonuclease signature motif containing protein [Minicystis sp.]